ncbi:uncharacterized protein RCC_03718 [Ramularia collo-cygni]|uniref:Uncharacterized protein n=1 Tax=Ramularia collo-cygni TaxID=112498 RepID=A0A2D3UNU3_9PEZI|nr:uncharacterized protein RCC_03718 [Ramularia collo-cygni]CZT17882.1 uncharacterized protein RCC_03718 [Ramularia collo-cygni]
MDNSPLNKLSPELLNTIAGMALTHDGDVILSGYLKTPNAAALTQTCKKMREDYVRLFFYSNTFKHVTRKGSLLVTLHICP